MKYNPVDQADKFLSIILEDTAPAIQKSEMKKAFIAGFTEAVNYFSFEITKVSDDQGVIMIEEIHRQLRIYGRGL